jgi:hypothetical protein
VNPSVLIPLIAAVAYVPLLTILVVSRPWQQRHRLFLLFLIPAVLWSLITFLSLQGWLTQNRQFDVSIVVCVAMLTLIPFHYLVRSFYQSERVRIPLAYLFLVATVVLVAATPVRRTLGPFVDESGSVFYGYGTIAIYVLFLCTVGVTDIRSLIQRYRLSPNLAERNQIVYLLASIAIFTAFLLISARGGTFPWSHVGNLVVAGILTYAVVTHRLLDIRVVLRQALIYAVLYGCGLGILLLLVWIVLGSTGLAYFPPLAAIVALGIPTVLFLAHKVYSLWQKKIG